MYKHIHVQTYTCTCTNIYMYTPDCGVILRGFGNLDDPYSR